MHDSLRYQNMVYDTDSDSAYKTLLSRVVQFGKQVPYSNNVGSGNTYELHPTMMAFPAHSKYITLRSKFNLAFALAEVLWICNGANTVEPLAFYNSQIVNYSDNGENFNAAYGERIFIHNGDQFEMQYVKLKENLETRQSVISIWNPVQDNEVGHKDYACNNLSQLLVRNGKLDWTQTLRSNDLIWGTPYNLVQFISLQQIMASMVGVEAGFYFHFCNSSHVYDTMMSDARQTLNTKSQYYESPPLTCTDYKHFTIVSTLLWNLEYQFRVDPNFDIDLTNLSEFRINSGWINLIATLALYCKLKHDNFESASSYYKYLTLNSYEQIWCDQKLRNFVLNREKNQNE